MQPGGVGGLLPGVAAQHGRRLRVPLPLSGPGHGKGLGHRLAGGLAEGFEACVHLAVHPAGNAQAVGVSVDALVSQPLKVGLVHLAHRAGVGGRVPLVDIAADLADPAGQGRGGCP